MEVAQTTTYLITNYQRDRWLNHHSMCWEKPRTLTELMSRCGQFLLFSNEELNMLLDKMDDLPRYKGIIERGIVIEKVTIEASFAVLLGVGVK